jgi:hypothetical protein
MRALAALVVSSPLLLAQAVSVGLRAGIPITPVLAAEGSQRATTERYTIGPLIEVHLWRGAALGADFLVQGSKLTIPSAGSRSAGVWRWETPITLIYRVHTRKTQPFVRAGVSFNRVFDTSGATECGRGPFGEEFYCLEGSALAELRHRGTSGFVAGAGFRFRLKALWIEPEVRVTQWIDRNFGVRDSTVRSNLNQIGLLLGVIL